jgi:hypothetical protein
MYKNKCVASIGILIPIDEGVVCNIQSIQEHHQVSLLAAGE